ncbi:MAG: sigma-70 region 4 domain-containing protein [Eubacteriales bacterium]|nr:sigma-70 region 4 domain-containing protein [Eubacteriales bacterium]
MKNEAIYRKEGMSDDQIAEIRLFDEKIFNSNRTYARHVQSLTSSDFEKRISDDVESTLLDQFKNKLSVTIDDDYRSFSRYWWIEEIENEKLAKQIKHMNKKDIEILTLIVVDEKTHKEIASMLGISVRTIERKQAAFRKILTF